MSNYINILTKNQQQIVKPRRISRRRKVLRRKAENILCDYHAVCDDILRRGLLSAFDKTLRRRMRGNGDDGAEDRFGNHLLLRRGEAVHGDALRSDCFLRGGAGD